MCQSTFDIKKNELGINLNSARLGLLLSKIIELREPPLLTDEEALAVALSVPAVASRVEPGCRLSGGGAFSSDEVFAGVSCDRDLRGGVVSINLRTGQIADAETRQVFRSEAAANLTRKFLDGKERRRSELRKEIQLECGQ